MLLTEFLTTEKNAYTLIWGPTGCEGKATLNRSTIQQEATLQRNTALMDFEPLENTFSGVLKIRIMNKTDLENALYAYKLFRKVVCFHQNYQLNLETALLLVSKIDSNSLHCTLEIKTRKIGERRHLVSHFDGSENCFIRL
jgi:replication-associated recombination protein RarA